MKRKTLIVLIILTLSFIWIHSAIGKEGSSAESSWIFERVRWLLELLVGPERATVALLRKLAHFTEFFFLGSEVMLLYSDLGRKGIRSVSAVLLQCNFCAFLDETIQIFSGRGPAVSDIWIDTFGAAAGILLILALVRLIGRVRDRSDAAVSREERR